MSELIPFLPGGESSDEAAIHDTFLVEEGLALISAYRDISDPALRAALVAVVKILAGQTQKTDFSAT